MRWTLGARIQGWAVPNGGEILHEWCCPPISAVGEERVNGNTTYNVAVEFSHITFFGHASQ